MNLVGFPLNLTDLSEQTYMVLRENILKRHIKPGERISVDEIAHMLGVSRTPVMDALKRLASDGLVEIIPRRGTFVTQMTAQDVAELFDIRIMIELYAAERILKDGAAEQFLRDIEEPMRVMEEAMVNGDYGDYEAFISADRELHLRLVSHAKNQRLLRIYRDMNVHMQIARTHYMEHVENARQAHEEHLAIVKAFQSGDPEAVAHSLRFHITNVKQRILELLEEHGGRL